MGYLDDCTDVPAEKVADETFNVKIKKQNQVVSAAGILLCVGRECSTHFFGEALHFMHSSVLTSSEYIKDLWALKEF